MDQPVASYGFLGVLGLLLASLIVFRLYLYISTELTWASRIRCLLEREGYTVQQMERRWLTRGPFPDMGLPGARHHREWLVRVIATDREHRKWGGWVRWRRPWPWTKEERWALQWDDAPWVGELDGPLTTKGWSSRVFLSIVMGLSLLGALAGIWILANGFLWRSG